MGLYHKGALFREVRSFPYFNVAKKWLKKPFEKHMLHSMKTGARATWDTYGQAPPIFTRVEIETINRCNMTCAFCPVNKNADTRIKHTMSEELFDKIILELKQIDYAGSISLYSNNEPFLDSRMEAFSETLRLALPKAHISIFTNGTVLTLERFIKVIPFLDEMCIDNYRDDLKLIKPVAIIDEYVKRRPDLRRKVIISRRKINEVLSTRGGSSPNNPKQDILDTACLLPWNLLVIRPDGKLSLCCNDALGKNTLGDVAAQGLLEAWHSKRYSDYRKLLATEGRRAIDTCRYCDVCMHECMLVPRT